MSGEERTRATYRAYAASGRARLWDPANRGYARLSRDRDAALTDLMLRSLPASARPSVLDVGCGDGSMLASLLDRRPEVNAHGVDLLPEAVATARERAPGASFVVASADALPYEDAMFDVVAAVTMFSSIPEPRMEQAAAREVARVLRPGGHLVWYDLRYDNPWNPAVHGVSGRRLQALFPGWDAELRPLSVLPPLARRLGPLTPVLYPLFHAVPPLRSHLIGRLRCPR